MAERVAITRVERVYQQLRQAIIEGEFPPGTHLRVEKLSRMYDMSLIPIREALRKLEVERLVEAIPNKGVRVAAISRDDVRDVYATRVMLELEALRRAWPSIDSAFVEELKVIRQEMVEATHLPDPTRAYELHRQVHFSIYQRSASPWLMHLIEILWSHTERYRRMTTRLATFIDEDRDIHGRIVNAIADGDLEEACESLRQDLERTPAVILGRPDGFPSQSAAISGANPRQDAARG